MSEKKWMQWHTHTQRSRDSLARRSNIGFSHHLYDIWNDVVFRWPKLVPRFLASRAMSSEKMHCPLFCKMDTSGDTCISTTQSTQKSPLRFWRLFVCVYVRHEYTSCCNYQLMMQLLNNRIVANFVDTIEVYYFDALIYCTAFMHSFTAVVLVAVVVVVTVGNPSLWKCCSTCRTRSNRRL